MFHFCSCCQFVIVASICQNTKSCHLLSCPFLSCPIQSCQIMLNHVKSCQILLNPVKFCGTLSNLVKSCQVHPNPVECIQIILKGFHFTDRIVWQFRSEKYFQSCYFMKWNRSGIGECVILNI